MDLPELLSKYPYMASPAALASADMGDKFRLPPHLDHLNRELAELAFGENNRLMANVAYQHGKTLLASIYFPAWLLLWNPDMRIVVVGNEEDFATNNFGLPIRDIIKKWGEPHGIRMRSDIKAKGAWKIEGREGGVTCKGPHGGVVGRPADLFVIDDLIRHAEEALSFTIMDAHWKWYTSTVLGRMRAQTKLSIVNTRWSTKDLCGRILATAKQTGEKWRVVKYKAIAGENDPLGRKPGEALWPEQVTLQQLLINKKLSPFWEAGWQQEPRDEGGSHFRVGTWSTYGTIEGGWTLPIGGVSRVVKRQDLFVIISVDWAASERKRSDYTCIGVYGVTQSGCMLVLEIINDRFPLENVVPELAKACEKWRPGLVVVESGGFQTAVAMECRRHWQIPEPRRVTPYGTTKLQRAYHAITLGQGGRIYLPGPAVPKDERRWLDAFEEQLVSFTGDNDDHDDMVDSLAYASTQCQYLLKPANFVENRPLVLLPGFQGFIGN